MKPTKLSPLVIFFSLLFTTGNAQIVPIRNVNNNTYSYLDTIKRTIINKYEYDHAESFIEGLAKVNRNGLWGFIDLSGVEVIPCQYINANNFRNGIAIVSTGIQEIIQGYIRVKDEKYGVIDKTGKKIIPFEFSKIKLPFTEGIAEAQDINSGKWGWIDESGKWKITPIFDWVEGFNNKISRVEVSGKYGCINSSGNTIIPIIFGYLDRYDENIIIAGDDRYHQGFIDNKGEVLIPFLYEEVNYFNNGLAKVKMDGKWGYIGKSGRIEIPIKYNYISDFKNERAWVNDNGFWGMINRNGEVILPVTLDFIVEGIAPDRTLVTKNGFWGLYDNYGEEIIAIKHEKITTVDSVSFRGKIKDHQYIYDIKGNLLMDSVYRLGIDQYEKELNDNWRQCSWKEVEQINSLNQMPKSGGYKIDSSYNFYKIIKRGPKFGVEDHNGKIIIDPIYDSIKNVNSYDFIYVNNDQIIVYLACYLSKKLDLGIIKKSLNNFHTIDTKIIKTDYEIIHNWESYNGLLIRVGKKEKFGLIGIIDDNVKEVIPIRFDDIGYCFADSLVFIKKSNLWGGWNIKLNIMSIEYQFENIKQVNGLAVCKKNKWALLNSDFKICTPFAYDNIRSSPCEYQWNYFLYEKKWGVINQNGIEVLRPILDRIIISPNHGNANIGIYMISKQAFKCSVGYIPNNYFDNPGILTP